MQIRGSRKLGSSGILDPVTEASKAPRRPGFLSLVLVTAWFIGLRTVHEGYVTLRILDDPLIVDSLRYPAMVSAAMVESTADNSALAVPVAAAQLVLGVFLLAVSAATLFGAIKRIGVCVQALLANAVLVVAAYVCSQPVRTAMVEALAHSPELAEKLAGDFAIADAKLAFLWGFRIAFALHLGALLALVWAVSRRSVREFLAFSASRPRES